MPEIHVRRNRRSNSGKNRIHNEAIAMAQRRSMDNIKVRAPQGAPDNIISVGSAKKDSH